MKKWVLTTAAVVAASTVAVSVLAITGNSDEPSAGARAAAAVPPANAIIIPVDVTNPVYRGGVLLVPEVDATTTTTVAPTTTTTVTPTTPPPSTSTSTTAVQVTSTTAATPTTPAPTTAPPTTAVVTTIAATTTTGAPVTTAPSTSSTVPASQLPVGNPGSADILINSSAQQGPSGDSSGNFRFFCGYSHMNYDDPIVWPNQPGRSHLHMFFGNKGVNSTTTSRAALTTPGTKGTCSGGAANLSGYWMPVLLNNGVPVKPKYSQLYYKSGYRSVPATSINDIPQGLVMVAGSAAATAPQSDEIVSWECTGQNAYQTKLWSCGAGKEMSMTVIFPQCWNGRDLDSPDHKSHMAYPEFGVGCPAAFPVAIPVISLVAYWTQPSGPVSNLRLSSDMPGVPAGASAHADYLEGWDRTILHGAVQHCIREKRDCTRGLGDGTQLTDPPGMTYT